MTQPVTPAERLSSPPTSAWPTVAVLLVVAPTLAALLATQLLAHRLGYAAELGRPWLLPALPVPLYLAGAVTAAGLAVWLLAHPRLRLLGLVAFPLAALFGALALGPVYPPMRLVTWLPALLGEATTRPFAIEALAVALALAIGLAALAAVPLRPRGSKIAAIAHGSARLATLEDLRASGLTAATGVRLGVFREGQHRVVLQDDSEDHVLLLMPTGAGKTTGHIIPTLLSTTDPAFVLDPKGELWQTTSGWRANQGHRCLLFTPTSTDPEAVAWNCLDEVRRGTEQMLDLRVLAESFIAAPAGEPHQSHWISSAQRLFQLLALHLLETEKHPTMGQVRALLNDPEQTLQALFANLLSFEHDPDRGYRSPVTGEPTATHPEVAMLARSFLSTPDRELGSIVSTLQRFLALWADPLIAKNTSRSDFSLTQLLSPATPTTLYIGLPYGDLQPLGPLLRILLGLLIRRMTEGGVEEGASSRRRTLFLLDEFAALGRLPILERMLGFFRGYGIRAVIVVQDLGQLVRNYSLQETISGNCQLHVAAATQSARTRAHLSALAGEATVRYRRRSRSGGRAALFHARTTVSETEARRPLLTTGEVGTLGKERLLILKTGAPPVLAWKSPYFTETQLVDRARALPPTPKSRPSGAPKLAPAPEPPPPLPPRLEDADLAHLAEEALSGADSEEPA